MSTVSTEWARAATVTVRDIANLMRTMPTPDAPPHERAAWLQRKVDLLQRIEQRD